MQVHFFWEKTTKPKGKARFNLLLLEYGEYYFEDFSVYLFPVITPQRSYDVCNDLKVQGRLKLCSRCLIFEPNDTRRPVIKFPLRSMNKDSLGRFLIDDQKESRSHIASSELSGLFTFECNGYFDMKANDKIGPYRQVDSSSPYLGSEFFVTTNAHGSNTGIRALFALIHSDLSTVLTKIENLKHIYDVSERDGKGLGEQLLSPLVEASSLTSFDASQLINFHEVLLLSQPISVKKVRPLLLNPGSLMITNARIYFQPAQLNNTGEMMVNLEMRKIVRIFKRRYLLRQTGLEIFMHDGHSTLFVFSSRKQRDDIYRLLLDHIPDTHGHGTLDQMTRKWQRREISNFEYLMHLNTEADRSMNDITQYPVFPHVLADYTSEKLDLENPATFRDLSRPIGALNPQRLEYFKERFHSMTPGNEASGIPPPFLYGTHYSTPGYVLFYLVRVAPEYMLCLQNGKFDAADRMFHSVADMWSSCLTNHADLKELIPEFFCGNGNFLVNNEDLNMGHRHTGERLGDVELPPWAKSPRDFIKKQTKALESEYVSAHLHEWIDLVFGYQQQGQAAVDADNLYYYLTYEGSVDLELITDPRQRSAIEVQIQEFGQTPKQLFSGPHPSRRDIHGPIRLKDRSHSSGATNATAGDHGPSKHGGQQPAHQHQHHESSHAVSGGGSRQDDLNAHWAHPSNKGASSTTAAPAKTWRDGGADERDATKDKVWPVASTATGTSTSKSSPQSSAVDDGPVRIMTLDEEFRAEVARELTAANSGSSSADDNINRRSAASAGSNPVFQYRGTSSVGGEPAANTSLKSRSASLLGTWTEKTVNFFGQLSGRGSAPNAGPGTMEAAGRDQGFSSFGAQSGRQSDGRPTNAGSISGRGTTTTPSPVMNLPDARTSPSPQQASSPAIAISSSASVASNSVPTNGIASSPAHGQNTVQAIAAVEPNLLNPNPSVGLDSMQESSRTGAGASASEPINRVELHPSDPIRLHSDAVTGIGIVIVSENGSTSGSVAPASAYGRPEVKVTLAGRVHQGPVVVNVVSCSKDSLLKVVNVEVDVISDVRMIAGGAAGLFKSSIRRTFSGSDPPLTSCCITSDGKQVIASCLDNCIYSYSVPSACALGKRQAHDDGVSALSMDNSNRWLLSGAWDATVKLWELKSTNNAISNKPTAVFYDHENSVQAVALDGFGEYAAAGADDGSVLIWRIDTQSLIGNCQVSAPRAITCLKWLPRLAASGSSSASRLYSKDDKTGGRRGFREEKLLCGSSDGTLACIDCTGRLFAAAKIECAVRSLCTTSDGRAAFGGCEDGSLRVWIIGDRGGALREIFRYPRAHEGACTSLAIHKNILVSGGEDGAIRVWRVLCS